jgi:hypothetical protein
MLSGNVVCPLLMKLSIGVDEEQMEKFYIIYDM